MVLARAALALAERLLPSLTEAGAGAAEASPTAARLLESALPKSVSGHFPKNFDAERYLDGPMLNARGTQADLTRLFGPERVNQIAKGEELFFKQPISTEVGKLDMNVMFNPKYSTVHFHTPDTQTVGSAFTLDVRAGTLNPVRRFVADDPDGIFHGLFARAGFRNLAAETADYGPGLFQERLRSIVEAGANRDLLWSLYKDPSRHLMIGERWTGGATANVRQAAFRIAPLAQPLETNGLATCSALCVTNQAQGVQYLAHLDAGVKSSQIANSIARFNLGKSDVTLMPGGLMHSSALENTVSALRDLPNGIQNLKFLSTHEPMFPGVVMQNGKFYMPAKAMGF